MALYLIGDVQGCDAALQRLLDAVDFSPSRDTLLLLGDLVNRGPQSLAVLRRLHALGDAARCVLGNHDLHLLASACGARAAHRMDTCGDILQAPDREALLVWLRHQPLVRREQGVLMVHAGLLPQWSGERALALSGEVGALLQGLNCEADQRAFFADMYGNFPAVWNENLQGMDRYRVIINACTRLRFCSDLGEMEFETKEGAGLAPAGFKPWFELEHAAWQGETLAFGHWSTLGLIMRPQLLALDTGCVWGGCLSAVRLQEPGQGPEARSLFQVKCEAAQQPGA